MVLRRQTGKQVTTGEPVFTKDAHELAGEVVDRFRRPQPHAQYRVVQQIERADMRLDSLPISRRRDRDIALRFQRTRQKITLRAQRVLQARLRARRNISSRAFDQARWHPPALHEWDTEMLLRNRQGRAPRNG
jgi:hypothetical protein